MSGDALTDEELARIHEAFAQVPYARLLGLEFVSASRGAAVYRLTVREELTRMRGILHGGAVASLMDTAAAFAVHTLLEPEQWTVTVDLTLHFLRPASSGHITAHARVVRNGRRLVILTIEAKDESGRLIAIASTTYSKQV
jgi:acyl-CoA thioesterase